MVLIGIYHHIVLLARSIEAAAHLHRVLEVDIVICSAVDNEQTSAVRELLGVAEWRVVVISARVILRQTVVDLCVDCVVLTPRGDGSNGNSHLKEPLSVQSAVESHKSAIRPTIDADTRLIDIWQGSEVASK